MINPATDQTQRQQTYGWRIGRILISGAIGAVYGSVRWIFDFWPLGAHDSPYNSIRSSIDLLLVLSVLPIAVFVLGLLLAAGIALCRRHFRRAASSVFAIVAIPVCFTFVGTVPLFDPWLWYVLTNRTRLEALAASDSLPNEPKYALLGTWDVSTGIAGLNPAHFVSLIFDESDAVGLKPSERPSIWRSRSMWPPSGSGPIPQGKRLYRHFFRVDKFSPDQ